MENLLTEYESGYALSEKLRLAQEREEEIRALMMMSDYYSTKHMDRQKKIPMLSSRKVQVFETSFNRILQYVKERAKIDEAEEFVDKISKLPQLREAEINLLKEKVELTNNWLERYRASLGGKMPYSTCEELARMKWKTPSRISEHSYCGQLISLKLISDSAS